MLPDTMIKLMNCYLAFFTFLSNLTTFLQLGVYVTGQI